MTIQAAAPDQAGKPRDERDLRFAPVNNASPRHLTREQIAFYNEHGYIRPLSVFSDTEVEANRAYFDHLLAELRSLRDGRDQYAINCYHTCCEGLWELMTHPRILDFVEDLVGPDIIGWASHYFCKIPFDPKGVPWHQDASYWPLTPARTVTVWLAIDDADEENAAMQFLPGTHCEGHLEWQNAQGPVVLNQEITGIDMLLERYGPPVSDELKAGQISLHADMLAHGSTPNRSARRRCGLTLRYCPPSVRSVHPDWAKQSILCRGNDPSGYWVNNPRPSGDNLSPERKPKAIGGN